MEELADSFIFGKANVYGTSTFYDFLKPENKGKKVYLCNGSACMTAGTASAERKTPPTLQRKRNRRDIAAWAVVTKTVHSISPK